MNRRRRRPLRIVIVRHGQSMGNVDESEYERTPDSQVKLTELGHQQARAAGEKLGELLQGADGTNPSRLFVYCSPYMRCQQTLTGILEGANVDRETGLVGDVQEPRLREQDFGNFQDKEKMRQNKAERARFGRFYYRFPQGESGADVYDRVSTWLESLFREMSYGALDDQTTLLVVTHGLTGRLFLMRWFHWTVEKFEETYNPPNGALMVMERGDLTGRGNIGYRLTTPTREALGLKRTDELRSKGSQTELKQPLTPSVAPGHSRARRWGSPMGRASSGRASASKGLGGGRDTLGDPDAPYGEAV